MMIHSGSRGLGYQVCDDYLREMREVPARYGIELPDRQLVCAPVHSKEGQQYLAAMRAAANFAWGNRHMLAHLARQTFAHRFGQSPEDLGMHLLYDVAHNIAKMETHTVDGREMTVCVHRKGATRAFPPGHPEVPEKYRAVGQPVLIPGDMGRASYVLAGQPGAMHGELRLDLPRRGAADVAHRRDQGRRRAATSRRNSPRSACTPRPAAGRAWPRSSPTPTRTSTTSCTWWRRRG